MEIFHPFKCCEHWIYMDYFQLLKNHNWKCKLCDFISGWPVLHSCAILFYPIFILLFTNFLFCYYSFAYSINSLDQPIIKLYKKLQLCIELGIWMGHYPIYYLSLSYYLFFQFPYCATLVLLEKNCRRLNAEEFWCGLKTFKNKLFSRK